MPFALRRFIQSSLNRIPRRTRVWLVVALAYLLIALIVTYPLAANLETQLAGEFSDSSDVLESVWGIWWWRHALLNLHQSPLQISVLNHPTGLYFPLYPLMAQTFLLALPVAVLGSPIFAYNFIFLISLVACGLAGYALCLEISNDKRASFVGGLIWTFFPSKMIQAVAGHLFLILLFSVPLAALGLIRTLRSPTLRRSLLTALAIVVAGTIHPIYLVYVVAPTLVTLTASSLKTTGRAFWRRDRVQALAIVIGLSGLLMFILILPVLHELQQGQAVWSSSPDVVGFSPDALGYFVPSTDNPLIRHTPLAKFAAKIEPYQYTFLIYAGWLPLILAFIGAYAQPTKSRPWQILAVGGAIFALGPVLKVGGDYARVFIAGQSYRIVMPYALIVNWPFVQWSRTPDRLTVLVMLAVSVLATLGLSRLLKRIVKDRIALLVIAVISGVVTVEYLVRFPFPTFSVGVPASIKSLGAISDGQVAIQLPMNGYKDNQRALYWQTIHQHPLVGGRVYRDQPGVAQQYDFYRDLLLAPEGSLDDQLLNRDQRLATLASSRIGWVIYDAAADPQRIIRTQLEDLLGQPLNADSDSAVFKLSGPTLPPNQLIRVTGSNWGPTDAGNGGRQFCQRGEIGLFASSEMEAQLTFDAMPAAELRRLTVQLNDQPFGHFVIGDATQYHTGPVKLVQGFNVLEFVDNGSVLPLNGPSGSSTSCSADGRSNYTWGPMISHIQFLTPKATTNARIATFGSALQLLESTMPDHVSAAGSVMVHLVWQPIAPAGEDLTVFVHLLDSDNHLIAQKDQPPLGNEYPTSKWVPGDVIASSLTLVLPKDIPMGSYQLRLGVYRQPTVERLPVSGVETSEDNTIRLGQLIVGP